MKKTVLKGSIVAALGILVCLVMVIHVGNKPKKVINCYTVGSEDNSSLPQAQEDRQYLISSYEKMKDFEDEFNVDLSKYISASTLKNNTVLILMSTEPDKNVSCNLSELYVDENKEPHMIIDKENLNTDNLSWYFISTIENSYAKELDFTRWTKY